MRNSDEFYGVRGIVTYNDTPMKVFFPTSIVIERIQMKKNESYWGSWAPYWSYFEDNFLDIESINKLSATIESPILIIGAGQGILVEQLQNKGFKVDGLELDPQMIKYAKDRRGIDLIQADAGKMPFADNSYRTSIIATGVIDFIDDTEIGAERLSRRLNDWFADHFSSFDARLHSKLVHP